MKTLTDIKFFDKAKGERIRHKDCEILNRFLLKKNDFYVVKKNGLFFVCLQKDGELISLWHCKEISNGEVIKPTDAAMAFRKKYLDKNITQDILELFIDSPVEYKDRYLETN